MKPTYSLSHVARHLVSPGPLPTPLERNPFNYYRDTERGVVEYLTEGVRSPALLARMRRLLSEAMASDKRTATRAQDNLNMLDWGARTCFARLERHGFTYIPLDEEQRALKVGGLRLSIRPQVALQRLGEEGREVGLLKLYCSKREALSAPVAGHMLALLKLWADKRLSALGTVRPAMVVLLDVERGVIHSADGVDTVLRGHVQYQCTLLRGLLDA